MVILDIDMGYVVTLPDGSLNPHVYKDAVFISPHKLPGGPGAPGVLVAKRALAGTCTRPLVGLTSVLLVGHIG